MDHQRVLKRNITPEMRAARERDIETVLDNYRENLRDHGATDEAAIDDFIAGERDKMHKEFDSLDNGDCSSNIYHEPTDWQGLADDMHGEESEEEDNGMSM